MKNFIAYFFFVVTVALSLTVHGFATDTQVPPVATNAPGIDPKHPINASGVDQAPSTNNDPLPSGPTRSSGKSGG